MKKYPALLISLFLALLLFTGGCNGGGSSSSSGDEGGLLNAVSNATAPVITGFSPVWQSPGSTITISGSNFDTSTANNKVKFNDIQAVVASANSNSLMVIVPSGATTGPVTVTTTKGTATSTMFFVVKTTDSGSEPTITGWPSSGTVGSTVIITGANFKTDPAYNIVTFNGTPASVIEASTSSLTVIVPDAISGNITVTTPGGTAISTGTFTINPPEVPTPTIKSFTPIRGAAGTTVTISGANFDTTIENNIVKFYGTEAVVTAATPTSITTTVPAGAAIGPITVTDPAGITANSPASFTITTGAVTVPGLIGGAIQGASLNLLGTALTFAGGGVVNSATDGTGTDARFNNPNGIATDGINLYIADSGNRIIRKIVIATGQVTTLAGSGLAGSEDGTGTGASFSTPNGITTDGLSLFIADSGGNRIRQITPLTGTGTLADMTSDNANVTTLAGSGSMGFVNSPTGTLASFKGPYGITTDGTNLFVSDSSNNLIRKIVIATSEVTTLAGSRDYSSTDGVGEASTGLTV